MSDVVSVSAREVEIQQQFGARLQRSLLFRRIVVGGAVLISLALILPLAIAALQAGLALLALAVLSLLALGSWKMLPWWILSIENRVRERIQVEKNRSLAALKAEARANPIEQLQNYLLGEKRKLDGFKQALAQIGAQVETMSDMLRERKKAKPNSDYTNKDRHLDSMRQVFAQLLKSAKDGDEAIAALREAIDDKKFDWQFAQVGQAAMQHFKAMNGQDLLNELLADESFAAIRDNFNRVFADIEVQIGGINSQRALTFGEGTDAFTIDLSQIRVGTPELVPASATK